MQLLRVSISSQLHIDAGAIRFPRPSYPSEGIRKKSVMQEGIHPNYPAARVTCACGATFVTRSTRGDFQIDVCSKCHPFYTGTMKLIDTAGRVDRFRKRYEQKKPAAGAKPAAAAAPAEAPQAAEATPAPAAEEPKPES